MKINFLEKNMWQKKNYGQRNCLDKKDGGEKNFGRKNLGHFLGKRNGEGKKILAKILWKGKFAFQITFRL